MVPENWSNQCNHQLLAPDVVPLGSDTEEQTSFQIGFLGGPMTVDRRPLFALQLIGPLPTALTFPLWPSASPSSLAGARPWQRQAHTSKIKGEFPGTPWAASGKEPKMLYSLAAPGVVLAAGVVPYISLMAAPKSQLRGGLLPWLP